MRFFATLRMTMGEGLAMTVRKFLVFSFWSLVLFLYILAYLVDELQGVFGFLG